MRIFFKNKSLWFLLVLVLGLVVNCGGQEEEGEASGEGEAVVEEAAAAAEEPPAEEGKVTIQIFIDPPNGGADTI